MIAKAEPVILRIMKRTLCKPLNEKFETALKNLEDRDRTLKTEASLAHMKNAKDAEALARQQTEIKEQRRKGVYLREPSGGFLHN